MQQVDGTETRQNIIKLNVDVHHFFSITLLMIIQPSLEIRLLMMMVLTRKTQLLAIFQKVIFICAQ